MLVKRGVIYKFKKLIKHRKFIYNDDDNKRVWRILSILGIKVFENSVQLEVLIISDNNVSFRTFIPARFLNNITLC